MINFLKNWVSSISISVIIASIFEMIIPEGKLKKYIKVILGIYIVLCIISPFVNSKELFSFDISKEIEKYESKSSKTIDNVKDNIQEIYLETFEEEMISNIEKQGFNVRSCLVDATFEGTKDDIGIRKITIVLSSKNDNYYLKDVDEIGIKRVEEVQINISSSEKNKKEEKTITSKDMDELKNYLADFYKVNKKIIEIQNY